MKSLSLFAAATVIATIFGRTVTHLHRKDLEEGEQIDSDLRFWRRHDYLDNILLNTLQYLPDHLQIRSGLSNPRIVLLHINIQASTICLHQAANFKASSSPNRDGDRLEESKARCLGAMENMLTILRLVDPAVIGNVCIYTLFPRLFQKQFPSPFIRKALTWLLTDRSIDRSLAALLPLPLRPRACPSLA